MRVDPIRDKKDIERIEHYLRYYSYRDWFVFRFGINSALRVSDMLGLQVRQVKDTHLRLRESKTRKMRRFFINEQFRPIIDDYIKYMDDEDYLFRHLKTNRLPDRSQVYKTLRKACAYAGIEHVGTHTMRKTFAYHFYRDTGRIAELMEILNHSTERQTLIYIGVIQEEVDDLVRHVSLGGATPWITGT